MHRTLNIDEIVDMICYEIEQPAEPESRDALASVAQTCKALQGPALDILSSYTTPARLLIHSMPRDMWEEQAYFETLTDPKSASFLGSYDWHGADYTELFATVAFCPPPEGFFPILHSISWHYKSAARITLPDFRPFLGPSVSSVAFDTLSSGSHVSLLPHIGQRYPRLKKLEIGFNFNLESPQDRQVSAISMLVRSLHALESLQLDQLDQAALEHIGRLPTLKSLTAHQLPARLHFSTTLAGSMFPALRTFNIFVGGIQPVTALITLASSSPLRVFHVEFPECPTSVQLHEFTTALTTHCDHTEMKWLTVQLAEEPVPPHAALYSLQPLSCFVNVLRVEITSSIGFDLDDEMLLLSSMERPQSVNVTLASVRTLAQLCPHLEEL
ncbi:hypothetical protein C8R43DRAFT_1126584 [Mycena crocata]|nr:hypothetical protein C8R43DRAFT_1126584 [Mycena crocata]